MGIEVDGGYTVLLSGKKIQEIIDFSLKKNKEQEKTPTRRSDLLFLLLSNIRTTPVRHFFMLYRFC